MEDLIPEYLSTIKAAKKALHVAQEPSEREILSSIISDMEYSVYWMRHGHPPQHTEVYQEVLLEPKLLEQVLEHYALYADTYTVRTSQRAAVFRALGILTPRETEVWAMREDGKTYQEISDMLQIARSTVQSYYERAVDKIDKCRTKLL